MEALTSLPGDAAQLAMLFQNLLSNALKVHPSGLPLVSKVQASWVSADSVPLSDIAGRRALAYHRIDIVDNGIGFDEKYRDRIFDLFQRLPGKNEFAGTGIGLAICEKVVSNHGGAVTATSQPGYGARFRVYLPSDVKTS